MTDRELMQQALNYLDAPSSKVWAAGTQYKIIQALRARLAQPDLITPADVKQLARIEKLVEDVDPYTAPPQRDWQGLTDEDINDHWVNAMRNTEGTCLPIPEFARGIEAKLKEKNNESV